MRSSHIILVLVAALSFSCGQPAQQAALDWKPFNYTDAGVKASFPCEPKTKSDTIQQAPKPARSFEASCQQGIYTFTFHLPEHTGEFDQAKLTEKFDAFEKEIRDGFGPNARLLKASNVTLRSGMSARAFDAKSGGLMYRGLHTQNARGAYNLSVQTSGDPNATRKKGEAEEFDKVAQQFLDSFEIVQ